MSSIFLTENEQHIWQSLPSNYRAGWEVEREREDVTETREDLLMRYQMAAFDSPACMDLCAKAQKTSTPEELLRVAEAFDVTTLSSSDLAETFFVLGTVWTSAIIMYLLQNAQSAEDVDGVAHLTAVRRALIETNSSTPAA